jgi:putative transposase
MPDHFHLIISPVITLERAIQFIKGGFSHAAKKKLGSNAEIWQRGFSDHRIRGYEDFEKHLHYIHLNPMKRHLCSNPAEFKYSSAFPGWKLDPIPQGLKPPSFEGALSGTAKAVPFQNPAAPNGTAKAMPFQNRDVGSRILNPSRLATHASSFTDHE